jgi:hypothetical protein
MLVVARNCAEHTAVENKINAISGFIEFILMILFKFLGMGSLQPRPISFRSDRRFACSLYQ